MKNFGIKYSTALKAGKNPVWFMSEGYKLQGNLFTPANFDATKKYTTIVTATPAGAVKEQSTGLYAERLASLGYIALSFDHRTFGESEGTPRYREDPFMKVYDIKNAVTFLSCLQSVDEDNIVGLGICSGAGYVAYAAAFDPRIKKVATVSGIFDFAGWVTTAGALPFDEMLETSIKARKHYYLTNEEQYVDAWYGETDFAEDQSQWETRNQFWKQASHYYREGGNRGWYKVTNGDYRDAQSIDIRYMMNVNPMLKYLNDRPLLAIRGEIALTGPLSDEAISYTNEGRGELFIVEGASHIDLYHVEEAVSIAIDKIHQLFNESL
ncbi:alpha/beta hydrolase [Sediminitomix flava]|uniref:Xaa-Pro dipeptidyl-peptidase-like domain-containing protein n=1 Tax=Sediminitomix flava TaxID=379075 RepID=A0A315ZGH8_SEDFL|nr:alpha/beta hydrolase [Sediminitomix flava]PWJ44442.1 hypothetical protein BC781_101802 [Sediminitomix flava]